MNCTSCGHENPERARFCNGCGNALAPACPSCDTENPPGARFCNHCGSALAGSEQTPDPDPREFTPQHLAEKILTTRSSIEGERKHVTVVFMDVVGFTSMAEPADPEQVRTIINRCMETILEEVHRYEGTVNQFTGDGVMALFGAPLALEDGPRRAVSAALSVHRALEPLRREVRESLGTDFQMRVGIHSGNVVVGSIGNDLRMEYTAVGDTTNLASRLEQLASPGSVLISEAMKRQVAPFFELRDLGDVRVKGRSAAVRVFEVEAERADRGRIEAESAGGLTDFVGRGRELDLLLGAFRAAQEGSGQIVFMVGDAGMGKSRLLYEFRRRLASEAPGGHFWLEGRCTSYGQNTAFGPIADSMRRAYRIDESDDDDSAVAKVARAEDGLGGELSWTLPYVRSLLSLPVGDAKDVASFEQLDAGTRRSEMQRALEARLLRAATERTLVYVLEDLHWIDAASEEILTALAESVPTSRIMLVLTHRPGYAQPLGDRSYHTRVPLQALSRDEMAKMASAVLRTTDCDAELDRLIAEKAEGNPFFVEELTRSLLEEERIHVENERAELAPGTSIVSIPDRVQDVLAARIDRLEEEPKRAIQIASVIGREFALRLLDRISEAKKELDSIVEELRALELVYQKAAYPEAVFTFKHALTHDVAYESMLRERRKELHRAVGHAIEELYPDRLTEHYEALAHHFSRGESWEQALRYHDLAATKSMEAFANRAAAEHLRAALGIAERGGAGVSDAKCCDWWQRLAYVCSLISDFGAARDAFVRAAELSDSPRSRAKYLSSAAYWALWKHDYKSVDALLARSAKAANESESEAEQARCSVVSTYYRVVTKGTRGFDDEGVDRVLRQCEADDEICSFANSAIGSAVEWRADYRRAFSMQQRALEIAKRKRLPDVMIISGWFLAKASCCLGDYGRALRDLRDAVDLSERIGDRAWKTRLLNTLGWTLAEAGRDDEAFEFNRQSTELAKELVKLDLVPGAPELYGNAAVNLVGNRIAAGELSAAADQLASLRETVARENDPWMLWRYRLHVWHAQARLLLAQGEPASALEWTAREVAGAREHQARKIEARALELRGRALVKMDHREQARVALQEALEIATAIEYPPVMWRAESLVGELVRRGGDGVRAEQHFAQAQQRVHALVVPSLDEVARQGLERIADGLRNDPLGAHC